ncbi:hypothetical protein J6590_022854 [Homalodisca vitripennis]|nr:hypothetical protein J6590_022854 [Homalodisca vitripennis]
MDQCVSCCDIVNETRTTTMCSTPRRGVNNSEFGASSSPAALNKKLKQKIATTTVTIWIRSRSRSTLRAHETIIYGCDLLGVPRACTFLDVPLVRAPTPFSDVTFQFAVVSCIQQSAWLWRGFFFGLTVCGRRLCHLRPTAFS